MGQVDPLSPTTHQIHDFNPGIDPYPSGLFWTIRIPKASVQVNLGAGTASYQLTNVALGDYTKLINAFNGVTPVAAMASFSLQWSGVTRRVKVRDTANNYAGEFVENTAAIAWSASESGFSFVSDPASTSQSIFAVLGHEHNGVFFP